MAAAAAVILAGAVWCASGGQAAPELADLELPAAPGDLRGLGLPDVAAPWNAPLHALGRDTVPEVPRPEQKKPPCHADFGERAINGACYVAVADVRPPCGSLFQWGNRCVRPVLAAKSPNTSIRRE